MYFSFKEKQCKIAMIRLCPVQGSWTSSYHVWLFVCLLSALTYNYIHVFPITFQPWIFHIWHAYSRLMMTFLNEINGNDLVTLTWTFELFFNFVAICTLMCISVTREKGRDLTQSYDTSPYTHQKIQKATRQHKKPPKTSITQRLLTNLGRSVGVTIATQLVWFDRLQDPNLPTKFEVYWDWKWAFSSYSLHKQWQTVICAKHYAKPSSKVGEHKN